MSDPKKPASILAPFIEGLLEEKHSQGYVYNTERDILLRFDKYCQERALKDFLLTKEFLSDWCAQTETEGLSNHGKRVSVVRELSFYMTSLGYDTYIPRVSISHCTVLPHLFTEEERIAFFHEIDCYTPCSTISNVFYHRRLANEYKVLFRMIYCCGLRNSEACTISTECVNLKDGILTILNSKGSKDRLVYMQSDLTELCNEYYDWLLSFLGYRPAWFFPGKSISKPLRNTSINRIFNYFWNRTSVSANRNNKPTVHDLRFSFVTDRINDWAKNGDDVEYLMPYLSKYLGHQSIQDTYYYFHTSKQLFDVIKARDKTASLVIPEADDYDL